MIDALLALVAVTDAGLCSGEAARRTGVTQATASCFLGRLYWRGQIDRYRDGRRGFVYVTRGRSV